VLIGSRKACKKPGHPASPREEKEGAPRRPFCSDRFLVRRPGASIRPRLHPCTHPPGCTRT
jgi:hypothetical protein